MADKQKFIDHLQHGKFVPYGLFSPSDRPIELLWARKAGSLARCIHGSLIRTNTPVGQGFSVRADEFWDDFSTITIASITRRLALWQMLIF